MEVEKSGNFSTRKIGTFLISSDHRYTLKLQNKGRGQSSMKKDKVLKE